jgi:hypothetical protein
MKLAILLKDSNQNLNEPYFQKHYYLSQQNQKQKELDLKIQNLKNSLTKLQDQLPLNQNENHC